LTWVLFCKCVLPAQLPALFRKFRTPSIPGNNIYDTFPTGTWPDTTECCHEERQLHLLPAFINLSETYCDCPFKSNALCRFFLKMLRLKYCYGLKISLNKHVYHATCPTYTALASVHCTDSRNTKHHERRLCYKYRWISDFRFSQL
jgi:hypothetical protein